MASTSSSSVPKSFRYDVFLSSRGEDTSKTFVDHLYYALHNTGINTYIDDEKIEKGKRINDQIMRSIEDSRFHIIVFSKNYASSSWCLEQLVKIMECQKTKEQEAFTIFYDVEPNEVRHQSGPVGVAFAKHVNEESAGRWRDAMTEAAVAGWGWKNTVDGDKAKLIKLIVECISFELRYVGYLIGIETRVKNVVSSLESGFNDVRIIGIKGMEGSGKTALARAVFDHMSIRFEGKSFVQNVTEVSKGPGLKKLQNQILSDVLEDQSIVVTDVSNGKKMMKKMMRSRKVLVVLDDVDDIEQLEALAGEPNWFKAGSRIIITTRDEQLLVAHRVKFIHHVNLLSQEEAILLFSRHAFGGGIPVQGYEELSRKVVPYARGLPSKVKFLGSFLYGKTQREWADTIERLKAMSWKNTLELRFEGLEDQKEAFLDDACISKGQDKYVAMRILEMYGFDYQLDSSILKHKSSIMVSDTDHLCVHNHIKDVHGYINNPVHPYKLITEETEDSLVINKGSQGSEDTDLRLAIRLKAPKNMKELRFLYVDDGRIKWNTDEVSQYLPNTLESLYWSNYPFRCLPRTFQANNLINLEMNGSNISQLWDRGDEKDLKNLKFLDLSNSKLKTFDLGIVQISRHYVLTNV
ncbi:putative TIR domain, P-loop containing nucleoside triphosphate hydrolase [Helianthus annuus]|nr:putative TIR domain, P-loop containing nucleoside triphosphate hydrolase [Helianthus annuus]